jgi:uncharacterized SAM-binding protein YcdF (DUF218 family)
LIEQLAPPLPLGAAAGERAPGSDGPGRGEDAARWWLRAERAWPYALAAVVLLAAVLSLPRLADAAATAALRTVARELVAVDPVPAHVDAVAVHGGGPPSRVRERPAAAMLASGAADVVVAMGGTLPLGDPDGTYAGAVVRRLDEIGVDRARVVRMDEGLSTEGELVALRRLAESRGWHSLALSSSAWHTRRVRFLADRIFAGSGIELSVVADPAGDVSLDGWWRRPYGRLIVLSEWLKLAVAVSRS